jgi:Protein of unknown function (DUF2523)
MSKLLALVLTSLISSVIARVLMGAGLTFITYNWVTDILNDLIVEAQKSLDNLPEIALSFSKLLTLDLCLSMLLSTIQLVLFIKCARLWVGKS